MWLPDSTQQIAELAESNELNETTTFDAKAADAIDSTKEMAKDIAAMSTDGGVILYGVGEDDNGNPTILDPIDLNGVKERIGNVVQTCIQPPPRVNIKSFLLADNPNRGFVPVEVPPSPEAPHMVTKNGDNRYYGRNGPRNARLDAGQVHRLFEQRKRLRGDRLSILDEYEPHATIKPAEEQESIGYLRIGMRPPFETKGLLEPVLNPENVSETTERLRELIRQAEQQVRFSWEAGKTFQISQLDRGLSGLTANLNRAADDVHAGKYDAWLGFDGGMYLVAGGIARNGPTGKEFFEGKALKVTVKFLYLSGLIFRSSDYHGAVDIASRTSGLAGSKSGHLRRAPFSENTIDEDEAASDTRVYVRDLVDAPKSTARSLLGRLINVSTLGNADQLFEDEQKR
jgi:hypothetical protein